MTSKPFLDISRFFFYGRAMRPSARGARARESPSTSAKMKTEAENDTHAKSSSIGELFLGGSLEVHEEHLQSEALSPGKRVI